MGLRDLFHILDIVVAIFLSFVVIVSSFSGWPVVIGVAGVILIVQLIDGTIVTPRHYWSKSGINPILLLFALLWLFLVCLDSLVFLSRYLHLLSSKKV